MQRIFWSFFPVAVFLLAFIFPGSPGGHCAVAAEKGYHHLVVLGDPHLPGRHLAAKEQAIKTINSWNDVDAVVAVGDICEDRGTDEEYAAVKTFFARLDKPLLPVVGNHDFIYADNLDLKGKRSRAVTETRLLKLERFRSTFGLKEIFYSRYAGGYRLIFLSLDSSGHLAEISQKQLEWLRLELAANRKQPTIIFCHAPLPDTLRNYNAKVNAPNYIIQPVKEIGIILTDNPQVFLWVSGHTHTSPKEESFASAINLYEKRITNIHNTDMNRSTIWTNSLQLYPDRVVVRTYDHKHGLWLNEYERVILPPKF